MTTKNLPQPKMPLIHRGASTDESIPHHPPAWYTFCPTRELRAGPLSKKIFDRELVAFRTASGNYSLLDARCVHMGANLGQGCVVGETLQCPFHNWQFGVDGRCTTIPLIEEVPNFARQGSVPSHSLHGSLFFFNGVKPLFPMPFFDGYHPDDLVTAKPFTAIVDCPWYMVGANAVDVQHFSTAHDRRLKSGPTVDYPAPYAHRTTVTLMVEGRSVTDRLTRGFAGDEVKLEITNWAGTLLYVRSTLQRMRTFGQVSVLPLGPSRTLVTVRVFARRSDGRLARMLVDPASVWVRRLFIQKFLFSDIPRMAGTFYNPNTCIEIDLLIAEYIQWLVSLQHLPTGEGTT